MRATMLAESEHKDVMTGLICRAPMYTATSTVDCSFWQYQVLLIVGRLSTDLLAVVLHIVGHLSTDLLAAVLLSRSPVH